MKILTGLKAIFVCLGLSSGFFWAMAAPALVDGIAFFVNGEPVTLMDVYIAQQKNKVSQEVAVDMLINEQLHFEEIKKRNIVANDLEIDEEISRIAKQNQSTPQKIRAYIESNGGNWGTYREEIKAKILKQKLYQAITHDNLRMVDERALLEYYNTHKGEFSIPQSVEVVKYYTKNSSDLEQLIRSKGTKVAKSLQKENEILQLAELNPQIIPNFAQGAIGSFTPIYPIGEEFVTFLIKAKNNPALLPFEQVKNLVIQRMMAQKEDYVIYEYFEKLRSNAKVNIIRLN